MMSTTAARIKVRRPDELAVPERLRGLPWVAWRPGPAPERGKPAKLPVDPRTGGLARVDDPATWADLGTALAAVPRYGVGVGLVLTRAAGLTAFDLDRVRDPQTGTLDEWAARFLDGLPGTYAEVSASGTGVHAFADGTLPDGCRHRAGNLEAYGDRRYLVFTGDRLADRPMAVTDAGGAVARVAREYLTPAPIPEPDASWVVFDGSDEDLIRRACAQPLTGPRLASLLAGDRLDHRSDSESDYELARLLGFWAGRDEERVARLMLASAARRDKWEDHPTYLRRTVAKALSRVARVYAAGRPAPPPTPPPVKIPECLTSGPSPDTPTAGPEDRLLGYIRWLRLAHGRPVGLSARQAMEVAGTSRATAARLLNRMVGEGRLVRLTTGTYGGRLASTFDLPEFRPPAPTPATPTHPPPGSPAQGCGKPTAPPPYTRTPGGLLPVWHWSRAGAWLHFGDCPGRAAAEAVAGRQMAKRPGWWWVGGRLVRYAKGRGLKVGSPVGGAA